RTGVCVGPVPLGLCLFSLGLFAISTIAPQSTPLLLRSVSPTKTLERCRAVTLHQSTSQSGRVPLGLFYLPTPIWPVLSRFNFRLTISQTVADGMPVAGQSAKTKCARAISSQWHRVVVIGGVVQWSACFRTPPRRVHGPGVSECISRS